MIIISPALYQNFLAVLNPSHYRNICFNLFFYSLKWTKMLFIILISLFTSEVTCHSFWFGLLMWFNIFISKWTKISYISFLCIRIIFHIKKQCSWKGIFFGKLNNNFSIILFESGLKQNKVMQFLKNCPKGHFKVISGGS